MCGVKWYVGNFYLPLDFIVNLKLLLKNVVKNNAFWSNLTVKPLLVVVKNLLSWKIDLSLVENGGICTEIGKI